MFSIENIMKMGKFWGPILAVLYGAGFLLDYLFTRELRKKEKREVHLFFQKLYIFSDKINFTKPQQFMVESVLYLKQKIVGERIVSFRYFLVSLLISQYLTVFSFLISQFYEKKPITGFNGYLLIPFLPFTGFHSVISGYSSFWMTLEGIGLYWNNYLFDTLAIIVTIKLLTYAKKTNHFFRFALLDIFASYVFAYLCIATYIFCPPGSAFGNVSLNITSFIADIVGNPNLPTVWAFYSITTFVPILIYMSILVCFFFLKIIQWILVTAFHDFSVDKKTTPFRKIAIALIGTAFLVGHAIPLLWQLATR